MVNGPFHRKNSHKVILFKRMIKQDWRSKKSGFNSISIKSILLIFSFPSIEEVLTQKEIFCHSWQCVFEKLLFKRKDMAFNRTTEKRSIVDIRKTKQCINHSPNCVRLRQISDRWKIFQTLSVPHILMTISVVLNSVKEMHVKKMSQLNPDENDESLAFEGTMQLN